MEEFFTFLERVRYDGHFFSSNGRLRGSVLVIVSPYYWFIIFCAFNFDWRDNIFYNSSK